VGDSLKVLDPERPIREADIKRCSGYVSNVPEADLSPNLSVVGETAPWSSSWLPLLSLLL
jgi:hypothetical protein